MVFTVSEAISNAPVAAHKAVVNNFATRSKNRYSVGKLVFVKRPFRVSYPKNSTCGMNIPAQ